MESVSTCISNVVSSPSVAGFGTRPDIASLDYLLTALFFLSQTFLSCLLVAFLTLPAGSKNKVAGWLKVDKQVCRLLARRHLKNDKRAWWLDGSKLTSRFAFLAAIQKSLKLFELFYRHMVLDLVTA